MRAGKGRREIIKIKRRKQMQVKMGRNGCKKGKKLPSKKKTTGKLCIIK